MAYFKINEPNKKTKWIKNVDNENGTLTFSSTCEGYEGLYSRSSGIIADSELKRIKFHFKEKYPELEYLEIDY